MSYNFDENTSPKDIVVSCFSEIAEIMSDDGFKFSKSKPAITKKTDEFKFQLYGQSNRHNAKGESAHIWVHAFVSDSKEDTYFWGSLLAFSNAKQDVGDWQLYGKEHYDRSLHEIKNIVQHNLLPFFRRFEHDLPNFIEEVADKGFCPFGDVQVYDAAYKIPVNFLLKYGAKSHLNMAFQHYIDRHELRYVKPNMEKAISLLREGKKVTNNGEIYYAEFAVKHNLDIVF